MQGCLAWDTAQICSWKSAVLHTAYSDSPTLLSAPCPVPPAVQSMALNALGPGQGGLTHNPHKFGSCGAEMDWIGLRF